MKIFPIVVKRTSSTGGFIASVVNAGINLAMRFNLVAVEVQPGIAVEATRHEFRGPTQMPAAQVSLLGAQGEAAKPAVNPALDVDATQHALAAESTQLRPAVAVAIAPAEIHASSAPQNPAIAASLLGATGNAAKPAQNPAVATSTVINEHKTDQRPGFEIVRVKYDLTRRVGGNQVVQTAVGGRSDWTGILNSTLEHDGNVASFAGNALAARGGQLELSFADAVNKGELTITSATLFFYGRVFNTALNNANVQLRYDTGAGFLTLTTITGNDDFRTVPKQFALGANLDTWAKYNALRAACRADAALGETWQAELDAVEIEIIATKTDNL